MIPRDLYLNKLIERKHNRLIKVVTGIRRCGKSFLLNEILTAHLNESGVRDDHIIRVSMEGIANRVFRDPAYCYQYIMSQMTDSEMYYILIDEVQMMTDFVEVLNGLLLQKNADVYVTGSNSRFLSSDIATEFRGRGDIIRVHPLRFAEFMTAYDDRDAAWDDYYTYGGMPNVLTYASSVGKEDYLRGLFSTTYTKDIVDRNRLRNETGLDELLDVVASGIGSFMNPTKLENTFRTKSNVKLSRHTIDQYIGHLEDAFIVTRARRYDVKGKRYIDSPYKIYFEDIGLRNARLNFRQVEENHLMENILFNELVARGYAVDVGVLAGYGKDADGRTVRSEYEVDFVVNRGGQRYYIQSAYEIPSQAKLDQEKRSFNLIHDSFRKLLIVRGYMKEKIDDDGVIRMGLINFLLNDSALS